MSKNHSSVQLSKFSRLIDMALGLYFPPNRHDDLLKKLEPAAREMGFDDASQAVDVLLREPVSGNQWQILAKHLTVGETYFFREPAAFDALQTDILPAIFRDPHRVSRQLRVWSAAASTGEEPYSLAMLFDRLLPTAPGWSVSILASDVNPAALKRAKRGVFRRWSFRKMPEKRRNAYFSELSDGTFQISSRIRQMVTFFPFNLVTDDYPSYLKQLYDVDIIFCRNVLIYFSAQTIERVVAKLTQTLSPGGWLVVSPTEAPHIAASGLQRRVINGNTFFQKVSPRRTFKQAIAPTGATKLLDPADLPAPPAAAADTTANRPEPVVRVQSPRKPDLYAQALQLYRDGSYDAARKILEFILSADERALANEPDAVQLLVHTYANRRQLEQAEAWCRRAIAANKLNPRYYYLLATILQAKDDNAAAVDALKRTLFLKDDFALAHFMLGNILQQQGKTDAARRHFQSLRRILHALPPDAVLPGSEDVTAAVLLQLSAHLVQPAKVKYG